MIISATIGCSPIGSAMRTSSGRSREPSAFTRSSASRTSCGMSCVTRLLVAEFNARLAVEVPEGATAREWRELVDYLAYLLREREAKTT